MYLLQSGATSQLVTRVHVKSPVYTHWVFTQGIYLFTFH